MTRYVGNLVELAEAGRILENAPEQLLASLDRATAQVVGVQVRERPGHISVIRYRSSRASPLERAGFEPSVPLLRRGLSAVAERRCRTDKLDGSLSTGRLARRQWLGAAPAPRPFL